MNKEGWAPAVYLRRVSLKTCPSPESLKRLPAMGMQLRGETGDFEEVQEEVQEEEEQDTKRNSCKSSHVKRTMSLLIYHIL